MKRNIFILIACCLPLLLSAQQYTLHKIDAQQVPAFVAQHSGKVQNITAKLPDNFRLVKPASKRMFPTTLPTLPASGSPKMLTQETDLSKTSTEGTEFWVTFMQNWLNTQDSTETQFTKLIVAARESTTITVKNPNTDWTTSANASAGQILEINIPLSQAYNDTTDLIVNTGLLVTSTKDISLYSSNYTAYSYDAANIYPTNLLGKEYLVQTYGYSDLHIPEFAVLATEDNTSVTITTTRYSNQSLFQPNVPKTITLNKGQVIQVQCGQFTIEQIYTNELSGTHIASTKPVAVFQGDVACWVPTQNGALDHVYEQAIPLQAWGTEYIMSSTLLTTEDIGLVIASENNTTLYVDTLSTTLNKGEGVYFAFANGTPYVRADKPIACSQFIEGSDNNSANSYLGDPSMVTITPLEQSVDNITFGTFYGQNIILHCVNIIAHDTVLQNFKLDGQNVSTYFKPVPLNQNYNVARIPIEHGTHTIQAPGGVTAHVYGIGQYESYAYNVGCRMEAINEQYLDSIYKDLNICSTNLPYKIGTLKISKSGIYKDSTITNNHKTIYIYNAQIFNPFDSVLTDTISAGQSVEWLGQKYTQAGYHQKCWTPAAGCDSCYTLNLYENHEIYDTICHAGSYSFQGATKTIMFTLPAMGTATQIDYDYNTTDNNHIFNVHLHIYAPNLFYRQVRDTICAGEQYFFEGKAYTKDGVYTINKPTKYSCDSTIELYLTLLNAKETHLTAYLCKGDYYQFGSQKLTSPGQYSRITKTTDRFECDSTIYLTLYEKDKYLVVDTMSVCPKSSFKWRGVIYHKPGVYYDSLQTVFGCDSIFKLIATATPTQYGKDTAYFCPGDTVKIHGRYFWYETSFNDTLTSSLNCDSIRTTYIKKRPNFHKTTKANICQGDVYTWRGFKYNETGTYYDRYENRYGCDSIYELQLTVHPSYLFEQHAEICHGSKYTWRGKSYNKQGIYFDNLQTKAGCDSIYKLVLTIVPTHLIQDTIDICQGSYAEFHGHKWTTAGLHYDSLKTVACGCDSVFQVLVRVHPILASKEEYIVDEGNAYKWHGYEYDQEGTYIDTIKSVWGCDSICTLKLQICRAISGMDEATICSYEQYTWRGKQYNQNGTFYDTKKGKNGCDSTFMLKLHVTPTDYILTRDSVCDQNYFWHNMELTTSGFYTDTIYDPIHNNCVVGQLDLKVKKTTIPTNVTISPACSDDKIFEVNYSYEGDAPVRYSIIFDTKAQNHGFRNVVDSMINGPLTAKIPQYVNGEFIRPDIYHADLILENGVCDGYLKKCSLDIIIRYPSRILQQNWNDVVAIVNDKLNGGFHFSNYEWFVNNHTVEGTKSYLYQPDTWRPGDLVWANLTRVGESYAVPTCPITIQSFDQTRPYPVDIAYANAGPARKMIKITSNETGCYSLYNLQGTLICQGEIDPTNATTLYLSDRNAVYILQVQTSETNTTVTRKITF